MDQSRRTVPYTVGPGVTPDLLTQPPMSTAGARGLSAGGPAIHRRWGITPRPENACRPQDRQSVSVMVHCCRDFYRLRFAPSGCVTGWRATFGSGWRLASASGVHAWAGPCASAQMAYAPHHRAGATTLYPGNRSWTRPSGLRWGARLQGERCGSRCARAHLDSAKKASLWLDCGLQGRRRCQLLSARRSNAASRCQRASIGCLAFSPLR